MDISEILSSLTDEDIRQLKTAANSILNSDSGKKENKADSSNIFSADMLGNIGKIGNAVSQDDERTALIKALKPLLSEPRQQKADEVIKILRLVQLIPLLRDSGLLNGLL
ncbi:MAG: hypothetical protein IJZ35_07025 [Clostridia bacterium]|nr:hypothetical protein [Clostridia bacterium]